MKKVFTSVKKVIKTLGRKLQNVQTVFGTAGFTPVRGLFIIILVTVVIAMSYNIYNTVLQATASKQFLEQEQQKLLLEQQRNDQAEEDLKYFSSLEYQRRYAYDSLNLVAPGEKLYLIESNTRTKYFIDKKNTDPIQKENYQLWWQWLYNLMQAGLNPTT